MKASANAESKTVMKAPIISRNKGYWWLAQCFQIRYFLQPAVKVAPTKSNVYVASLFVRSLGIALVTIHNTTVSI
jgi:hypothetical protein